MENLKDLVEAMVQLKLETTLKILRNKLVITPAEEILSKGLAIALENIGRKFENEEYFLAEMLFAVHIMNEGMKILGPELEKTVESKLKRGSLIIGTVRGDVHDIGKNIFITLMKASGFEVKDLGVDVPTEKFIQAVEKFKPNILGMSALLSTTAQNFRSVTEALKAAGLRNSIYIMIGGPEYLTPEEADVNVYCNNAFQGVKKALGYISRKK